MLKMDYIEFEDIINKLKTVTNSKTELTIDVNKEGIRFIIDTKEFGLYIEKIQSINEEYTIKMNCKQLIKEVEVFKKCNGLYVSEIKIELIGDKLKISGDKHSEELDVEVMDYTIKEEITIEIDVENMGDTYINNINREIHGSDEWDTSELMAVLDVGSGDKIYIAGSKHKCFSTNNRRLTELPINKYIGQNSILGKATIKKINKLILNNKYDKYYLNNKLNNELHLQNWDGTFRLRVKTSKANTEDIDFYNLMTSMDYDDILITVIKDRLEDQLERIVLSNNKEIYKVTIKNCEEPIINIEQNEIELYIIKGLHAKEITIDLDIKSLYDAIKQSNSDFIAIDITKMDDANNDVILRVSEIDLEKYEDNYEEEIGNICHFDMRNCLNEAEHRKIREDCLNKKIYIL